jgi:hypothetical protein
MRFESHLGHSMTPRQRGFCFNVWTFVPSVGPSDTVRGLCLAPAVAHLVVWVAGSGSWSVGLPPAGIWGYVSSLLAVPVASCWSSLVHGQELWRRHVEAEFSSTIFRG